MPQLSELPLSICAAVMDAFPVASNCTVMFWHTAVGAMLSTTVTVALHVATLANSSVTVSVTRLAPRSAQVNVDGLTESAADPQPTPLPLST